MKKILFITTFVVFIFIPISTSADVIINEIAWMGTEIDSSNEWIELYNDSDTEINLNDWGLYEEGGETLIEPLTEIIGSKSYYLIERTDDNTVPSIEASQPPTSWSGYGLNNNGEHLQLLDSTSNIIDEVNCSGSWFEGDKDTKQTMERITDGWQTSSDPGGTPKTQNSSGAVEEPEEEEEVEEEPVPFEETPTEAPPTTTGNQLPIADAGDNIIGFVNQEIEFDGTKSSDPDEDELFYSWNMGDGKVIDKPSFTYKYSYPGTYLVTLTVSDGQDYALDTITIKIKPQQITINEFIPNPEGKDEENEWIEIYNDSDSIVDISGWQLDDEEEGSNPFIFPENSLMAPKNYLVFSRQITGIALNNDKDSVRLLLPEGMVFQEVNYENPKQGQSSARTDEGFVWNIPTPGIANITGPPQSIGSLEKQFTYQQPIESETTKEPSEDYSWYFQNPEQEIEGGFTIQEPITNDKDDKDKFAAVSSFAKATEDKSDNQATLNLVLMIIAVILAGLIIGLFLTKLSKKFP